MKILSPYLWTLHLFRQKLRANLKVCHGHYINGPDSRSQDFNRLSKLKCPVSCAPAGHLGKIGLRAGTTALRSAVDAVASGSAKGIMVTTTDCRLDYPRSYLEQLFGDGAAVVTIGNSGVIATIEAQHCHFDLGDNLDLGGRNKSKVHIGGVVLAPTVAANGRQVLVDGELIG